MSFNGDRLRLGRLFQGWTQRELAERVAVSHGLIGQYEKGLKIPQPDITDALAVVLRVEPVFFEHIDVDEFQEHESNFRRRIAATDRQRKQVLAHATLFASLVQHLRTEADIPSFNVPSFSPSSLHDVEVIAERTRDFWGLPLDAPIGSMSRLLENAGVLLLAVDMQTAERIDAFSRFGATNLVVLNTEKESPSRTLFDQAHELGHGVLHRTPRAISLDQREAEADQFASAFLLPRDAFTRDMMGVQAGEWDYLFHLKREWGVSVKAMLYRARRLGLIDAADYRTRLRYYASRHWNDGEPEEPVPDRPTMFKRLLERYRSETGKSNAQIAAHLGWSLPLFTEITGVEVEIAKRGDVLSMDAYRSKAATN